MTTRTDRTTTTTATTTTTTTNRTARSARTARATRTTRTGEAAGPRPRPGPGQARPRGAASAFARFVLCGGGVSLASSAALLAIGGRLPFAVANAVITVLGTVLATELHHRFTFAAARVGRSGRTRWARRAGWSGWSGWAGRRVHAQSALTLAAAYLVTTAAVLVLDAAHPHPGALLGQAVYLAAAGLAGIGRFAVLRLLVFARKADADQVTAPGGGLRRGEVTVAA